MRTGWKDPNVTASERQGSESGTPMAEFSFEYEHRQVVWHTHEDYLAHAMVKKGSFYELTMLEQIRSLALSGLYIDAGANIGNHTVYFGLFCQAKVLAYEPVPANFELLVENIKANGLMGQVMPIPRGLGHRAGTMSWQEQPDNMGMCRLVPATDPEKPLLNVCRLDDEAIAEPVQLLKIDCESMDLSVLKGSLNILTTHRPHLFVEAWKLADKEEIDALVMPLGYRALGVYNATPTYHYAPDSAFLGT